MSNRAPLVNKHLLQILTFDEVYSGLGTGQALVDRGRRLKLIFPRNVNKCFMIYNNVYNII